MAGLIIFDCDSTLSSLEGIDELARLRGEEIFRQSESMTRDAMEGRIPLESVFGRRLALISPTRQEMEALGQHYIDTVAPGAKATLDTLRGKGWSIAILSAGLLPAVAPLAQWLGIQEVQAVPVTFSPDGAYESYDTQFPPTRSGGKPIVVKALRAKYNATPVVMVGDGVSDLETKPEVDLFIGFGGFVERPKVKAGSDHWITQLSELPPLL